MIDVPYNLYILGINAVEALRLTKNGYIFEL